VKRRLQELLAAIPAAIYNTDKQGRMAALRTSTKQPLSLPDEADHRQ
jgi:hypothetical protein